MRGIRDQGLGMRGTCEKQIPCEDGNQKSKSDNSNGEKLKLGAVAMAALALSVVGIAIQAHAQYVAPSSSTKTLRGLDFSKAEFLDPQLTSVYQACDQSRERGGCATDPAHNTALLRFGDGTIFFDAKMAIDADGSEISKKAEHPNQPETALRYPTSSLSLDSERVPYIVMPLGDFRRESGVGLGDLAAVIKDDKVQFAIVGDLGPRTHIGEGSMKLHEQLGHSICTAYDDAHNCSAFTDNSIDPPVLYFIFPDSRKLIFDGLSAENINQRIATVGQQLWSTFLANQQTKGRSE
jgi:hypothetical protein